MQFFYFLNLHAYSYTFIYRPLRYHSIACIFLLVIPLCVSILSTHAHVYTDLETIVRDAAREGAESTPGAVDDPARDVAETGPRTGRSREASFSMRIHEQEAESK